MSSTLENTLPVDQASLFIRITTTIDSDGTQHGLWKASLKNSTDGSPTNWWSKLLGTQFNVFIGNTPFGLTTDSDADSNPSTTQTFTSIEYKFEGSQLATFAQLFGQPLTVQPLKANPNFRVNSQIQVPAALTNTLAPNSEYQADAVQLAECAVPAPAARSVNYLNWTGSNPEPLRFDFVSPDDSLTSPPLQIDDISGQWPLNPTQASSLLSAFRSVFTSDQIQSAPYQKIVYWNVIRPLTTKSISVQNGLPSRVLPVVIYIELSRPITMIYVPESQCAATSI